MKNKLRTPEGVLVLVDLHLTVRPKLTPYSSFDQNNWQLTVADFSEYSARESTDH